MNRFKLFLTLLLTTTVLMGVSNNALGETIPEGATETWSGTVYLDEPLTVLGKLVITAGTCVRVTSSGSDVHILVHQNGALQVTGAANSMAIFVSDTGEKWGGIRFQDNLGSPDFSYINHALILDAYWGVRCIDSAKCSVLNTWFGNCAKGGESDVTSNIPHDFRFLNCRATTCDIGFNLNGGIEIQNSLAEGCGIGYQLCTVDPIPHIFYNNRATECDTGIFVKDASDEVHIGPYAIVDNCTGAGIKTKAMAKIYESQIFSNGGNGIWALDSGSAYVWECVISNNYNNVVLEADGCYIDLGYAGGGGIGGYNKITDPVRYHVINRKIGPIFAQNCYWGGKSGSLPILNLIGDVIFTPYLVEDPF